MNRILLPTILAFLSFSAKSQTYTSTAGGAIPDAGPVVQFPLNVSGLVPSAIDTVYGLETICFNITHTWDADLNISLQAPDGTIIDLSVGNGGAGDDYTNTCLNASAPNSIVTGNAPFTGTFRPQGFIGGFNNGQNGNGTWYLNIQDTYWADVGNLIDWSITFGPNPAIPFNFTSSNLPIVVINTAGSIPNEPKVGGWMGVIYNGAGVRNYLTDPFNNYNDSIGIELRGSSSSGFPQKQFALETRDINGNTKDTILLEMPSENDWVLYAPYDDKTCMRNVLTYDIANKSGHYAPRTKFCEVMINDQYQGIYIMMEKIKRDGNRVDIARLLPTDITGDDLTGGYIIKIDRNDGPGTYWTSPYAADDGSAIEFVHEYPDPATMAPQQRNYIVSYIDSLEDALNGALFAHPTLGYRKYIDVGSFIDFFILNEVSRNVDGYRLSSFMYKDKNSNGGLLKAGPAWDFNLAWWNADYCDGFSTTGWAYDIGVICPGGWQPPIWWRRFLEDPNYTAGLRCRWDQLRQNILSIPVLDNYIDSIAAYLNEAQGRHFTAWPILGVYTWPNPSPLATSYAGEIANMKTWIHARIAWLDANMPGTCNVGVSESALNEQNVTVYPNPFNDQVNVSFYLPRASKMEVFITDISGKRVQQFPREDFAEGQNQLEISFGHETAKGLYFLNIRSEQGVLVKKITKM